MVHKLAIVAIAGLTISAACIGAAAAIGGRNFGNGFQDFSLFDRRPYCEAVPGTTASARDLDWDGSDHVGLTIYGPATYMPGSGERLHVSGDPQVLAHIRVRDGNIEMDCRGWQARTYGVTLTLPGREFRRFGLNGGGDLALHNLNQSELAIEIGGAGKVKANGARLDMLKLAIGGSGTIDLDQVTAREAKANIGGSGTIRAKGAIQDLKIGIGGSGRADFGAVASSRADVRIGGHGDVDIAPSEVARIAIGGSGDVTLHSNPKELETHIGGSGQIHRAAS